MTVEKINRFFDLIILSPDNEFFICGPSVMMDNAKKAIEEKGVAKQQIHIEYFSSKLTDDKKTETSASGVDKSAVTVIMDGVATTMELAQNGKVILDAALDAGVDVPYACKGAVCCTCRAKVLEGKVKMDNNFALTEEEVAEGFILTCQSHPLTPVVKLDYDC
jgi:ring-1,2-phenylacetyl-CoA epoxidase subunit PaaE